MNRLKKGDLLKAPNNCEWPLESESGYHAIRLSSAASSGLKPKQRVQSLPNQEFTIALASKVSYRTAIDIIKHFWHLDKSETPKRSTYNERIESAGASLSKAIDKKADDILSNYGVTSDAIISDSSKIPSEVKSPSLPSTKGETEIRNRIREYNRGRATCTKIRYGANTQNIEDSDKKCCYISVDDVLSKSQKSSRKKDEKKAQMFVSNTVVHIQYEGQSYVLTASGLDQAMKRTMAFLLYNHLLEDSRLIFFSDGATSIRDAIHKYFSFRQYTLILDWYHLEKKCNLFLSMGVRGSMAERKEIKKQLAAILWAGNVEKAKQYVKGISKKNIKCQKQLEGLIAYLDRKTPYITCYAMRKLFGLRTSSNLVEKSNDRVVSARQKKKGMSWSTVGSRALATLSAVCINGELSNWIFKKDVVFKMAV